MKICTICKDEKDLKEFNKNKSKKDGLSNVCRTCSSERSKKYYSDNTEHHKQVIRKRNIKNLLINRQKVWNYLETHPCVDCEENDPIVLEFDHRDDVDKTANVSQLIADGVGWDKIKKEIDKCDVRCANCHRRRTAIQFGWYKGMI